MRMPCRGTGKLMPDSGDGRRPGWRLLPGPDPGAVSEQGDEIQGLAEVAVERRCGRQAVLTVAGNGDEDTFRSLGIAAERRGHLDAAHAGERQVEEHDVWFLTVCLRDRRGAIENDGCFMPLLL